MKNNSEKTFGQIAYEADPRGGIENFGPWENLRGPTGDLIKGIHENMGNAVVNEVKKRLSFSIKHTKLLR